MPTYKVIVRFTTADGTVLPNFRRTTTASTIPTPGDEYPIEGELFYVCCVVSREDSYYVCIQFERPRRLATPFCVEDEHTNSVVYFRQNAALPHNIRTAGKISLNKWDSKTLVTPMHEAKLFGIVNTTDVKGKASQMDSPAEFVSLLEGNPNRPFLVEQTRDGFVSIAVASCIIE